MVGPAAAAGLRHRRGSSPARVLPPGLETDAPPVPSRGAPAVGMGPRLLPCQWVHPPVVRGVVRQSAAGAGLGAEDVPVAEDQAACDLPDLALGGGDSEPAV